MDVDARLVSCVDVCKHDVAHSGAGRGGAAAHLRSTLQPRSMAGIHLSSKALEFCPNYYSNGNLSFVHGDAENIPLADHAVDAVINLESSHCYGSMTRFLSEVRRVLRPGGYFLFSDHRDHDRTAVLRGQLNEAGLKVMGETDITQNVVRALELDNDRKQQLIKRTCPKVLHREAGEFAALKGTRTFEAFKTGYSRYMSFVLQKSSRGVDS